MPTLRLATPADAAAICAIYNHYVATTVISFEEQPVSVEDMQTRIRDVTASLPWLICEQEGRIVGYAYATKWRVRPAYRRSVETSVYLDKDCRGKGLGRLLYTSLLARLTELGLHCAIGGITQPNEASVRLHESLGFTKVAHFREVGNKFGRWLDVAYWERLLEKSDESRSA
jgi:phosphinothricin acetyltransferase